MHRLPSKCPQRIPAVLCHVARAASQHHRYATQRTRPHDYVLASIGTLAPACVLSAHCMYLALGSSGTLLCAPHDYHSKRHAHAPHVTSHPPCVPSSSRCSVRQCVGFLPCAHLEGSWRIAQHLNSQSRLLTSCRFVTCCSTSRLTTLTCARRRRQKRWRDQTDWEEGFCTVPTASPMWCRRGCSMAQSQRLSTMSRACPHAYACSMPFDTVYSNQSWPVLISADCLLTCLD